MYLLDLARCDLSQGQLSLREFIGRASVPYAVLSHCWGTDEVHFADIGGSTVSSKAGFVKIRKTIEKARIDGFAYLWIDTCCIDKKSSSELTEAINSMFKWYQEAAICYAYLEDVGTLDGNHSFENSRWFTRGWTLQELIAPQRVHFFSATWDYLGSKQSLGHAIAQCTGIDLQFLQGDAPLSSASIAQRMSWAAERKTTRVEDIAYSLLGIFDVNIPLMYGEGQRAFTRLQEAIMHISDDQSLFAWESADSRPDDIYGLLAASPDAFKSSGAIKPYSDWQDREPFQSTNRGLRIQLGLTPEKIWAGQRGTAVLLCQPAGTQSGFVTIEVVRLNNQTNHFARIRTSTLGKCNFPSEPRWLYFPQNPTITFQTASPYQAVRLDLSHLACYEVLAIYNADSGFCGDNLYSKNGTQSYFIPNWRTGIKLVVLLRQSGLRPPNRDCAIVLGTLQSGSFGFYAEKVGPPHLYPCSTGGMDLCGRPGVRYVKLSVNTVVDLLDHKDYIELVYDGRDHRFPLRALLPMDSSVLFHNDFGERHFARAKDSGNTARDQDHNVIRIEMEVIQRETGRQKSAGRIEASSSKKSILTFLKKDSNR